MKTFFSSVRSLAINPVVMISLALLIFTATASGQQAAATHEQKHEHQHQHDHSHQHTAPHGGSLAAIEGCGLGHVEAKIDGNTLEIWFLDGGESINRSIPIPDVRFPLSLIGSEKARIELLMSADPLRLAGEKPERCSHFTGRSDELLKHQQFEGYLWIHFKGKMRAVTFTYPDSQPHDPAAHHHHHDDHEGDEHDDDENDDCPDCRASETKTGKPGSMPRKP